MCDFAIVTIFWFVDCCGGNFLVTHLQLYPPVQASCSVSCNSMYPDKENTIVIIADGTVTISPSWLASVHPSIKRALIMAHDGWRIPPLGTWVGVWRREKMGRTCSTLKCNYAALVEIARESWVGGPWRCHWLVVACELMRIKWKLIYFIDCKSAYARVTIAYGYLANDESIVCLC